MRPVAARRKLRPMLRRLLAATVAFFALAAAPAAALPIDVVAVLGDPLSKLENRVTVPVLLPDSLDFDYDKKLYGSGGKTTKGYDLSIAGARNCGANACSFGSFSAERGGTFAYRSKVTLRGKVPARFKGLTCGASCSPAAIQFRKGGVLYEISAKLPLNTDAKLKTALTKAANQALKAGDRMP